MKRLPLYLTILALACLGSCVYPYDSLPESRKERTLVVDGRILIGGISSIQLNYVTPLNAIGGSYPSGDAWIEDDLGNIFRDASHELSRSFSIHTESPAAGASSYRAVVEVDGERYASDWIVPDNPPVIEDITFENSSGEGKEIGQAVAVFTDGDFLFFNRCRFIGNQDTLYTYGRYGKFGGIKRNYYKDCYIEGTTDFIFGPSISYFENCHIHSKKNSYVTAASTLEGQKYGYVFVGCRLTADEGIDQCYLGRPWGAYARTVFIRCELGSHILPDGWHDWEKDGKPNTKENSYYAEYKNFGPGARGPRVGWSHQLTDKEAGEYSFEKVMFQEEDGIVWDPYNNK